MQKLYLVNTLTKKKEEFVSQVKNKASFYYCGPTVYWTQHIGNLRGSFCADLVLRSLEYFGYDVTYVRNYTDVGHLTSDEDDGEDKMEKASKREGLVPEKIADKYIKTYEDDTRDLNIMEPDYKPRATRHIKEMIEMIKVLIDKGFAYQTKLAIYFDTSKFKNYTALSGQVLEENRAGAGTGDVIDNNKKNSSDFVLWFFKTGEHKNAIQTWPSQFETESAADGEGFPGWHLECSAMSKKYLGKTIDIHMGGIEHVPVHHTNEIAQSEAANGVKFANYWLHNEHLLVNGRKMAKSEGTGFSLKEIKEKGYDPLDLRFFFLQAGYRAKQNFTWEALNAAKKGREHLNNQVRLLGSLEATLNKKYSAKFREALGDDINTTKALAVAQELLKSKESNEVKLATVLSFDKVFGLKLKRISEETIPQDIENLIAERKKARLGKKWAESDRLRDEIENKGYIVEDTGEEIRVYKK